MLIVGLSSASVEAKRRKYTPKYRFGGEYTRRDKEQETTFKLIMQEFSSPEGKTVGNIDMVHREFYAEYMGYLKDGITTDR